MVFWTFPCFYWTTYFSNLSIATLTNLTYFNSCIIVHCMNISQQIHPFPPWLIFNLFPFFFCGCFCKYICNKTFSKQNAGSESMNLKLLTFPSKKATAMYALTKSLWKCPDCDISDRCSTFSHFYCSWLTEDFVNKFNYTDHDELERTSAEIKARANRANRVSHSMTCVQSWS